MWIPIIMISAVIIGVVAVFEIWNRKEKYRQDKERFNARFKTGRPSSQRDSGSEFLQARNLFNDINQGLKMPEKPQVVHSHMDNVILLKAKYHVWKDSDHFFFFLTPELVEDHEDLDLNMIKVTQIPLESIETIYKDEINKQTVFVYKNRIGNTVALKFHYTDDETFINVIG